MAAYPASDATTDARYGANSHPDASAARESVLSPAALLIPPRHDLRTRDHRHQPCPGPPDGIALRRRGLGARRRGLGAPVARVGVKRLTPPGPNDSCSAATDRSC